MLGEELAPFTNCPSHMYNHWTGQRHLWCEAYVMTHPTFCVHCELLHCYCLQHINVPTDVRILCFVDQVTRYNCVKKKQLDAQLILNIFRQPLHVSGISRPIIRRYNHMYTTIGTYCSFRWLSVVLVPSNQDNRQSSKKNNKYQWLYTYNCTSWWWA